MSSYRALELLVSRIEGALAPAGATIRSPDRIPDVATGELREVDVSIRHRVGSVELLVTVECRDRIRIEDITWIEQLATKRDHIGAAHTIAVSSTGFSAPAIRAAKLHGISTRIIGELSDADILEWIDKLQIEEVDTACQLGRLHLVYEGDHPGAHMDPAMEQEWTRRGFEAQIFAEQTTGSHLSLVDLIKRATPVKDRPPAAGPTLLTVTLPPQASMTVSDDPLTLLARDVPADGSSVEKMFWIEVKERELSMQTTCGILTLTRVGFEITMSSTRRRVPASRIVSYSDDEKGIVDVAEHHSGRYIITQHRPAAGRPSDPSN